jgi:hypothetical protein
MTRVCRKIFTLKGLRLSSRQILETLRVKSSGEPFFSPGCIELIARFYCCRGEKLKELVELSHQSSTTVILDEVNLYFPISIVSY